MTTAAHEEHLNKIASDLEAKVASSLSNDEKPTMAVAELAKAAVRARCRASELAEKRAKAEP
ncbi:MAG: hypothetical protein AB7T06_40415 [Kofleriaceae bacterium]